jgi:hypothetical protein
MKQITIRGIPEDVEKIVKKEAVRKRTSLNKAIVSLLEKAAGTGAPAPKKPVLYHDLDHFAGMWAREEAEAFNKSLELQRAIDEDLWKKAK